MRETVSGPTPSAAIASAGSIRQRPPAPAPDVGIEAGVDEDRLVAAPQDPEVVVEHLRAVGLAVGLVAVVGLAAGRLERRVAHGEHAPAATHRRPRPRRPASSMQHDLGAVRAGRRARRRPRPQLPDRGAERHRHLPAPRLLQAQLDVLVHELEPEARAEGPRQHVPGELVRARGVAPAARVEDVEQRARRQAAVHAERQRLAGDRDRAGREQVVEDLGQLALAGLCAHEHDVAPERLEQRAQRRRTAPRRRRP